MENQRIRHSVIFKLKSPKGSEKEKDFLESALKLQFLPGIEKFELMKQVSPKNKFDYGISMEFANREVYDKYTNHLNHIAFVTNVWIPEVEDFLEIDNLLD